MQQNITGRTQVTLEAFGNVGKVEVMNGTILTFGINLRSLPEGADVAAVSTELPTSDDYLDSTSFTIGTTKYAAASAQYGYVVVAADGDNPPGIIQVHDGEFDSDRIKSFGSGFPPKGIAFDPVTQKLLLGGNGRVIVLNAQNDFLLTPDASGDFVLAGSTSDVAAIAARGGFAYILLRRSNDNVIKLDLSQSPPRAIDVATVDVSSFGRTLAVGCQRLFVGGFDKVVAVSRDTLDVSNTLAVRDTRRLLVVRKSELGLAGDL